jgi:hypothetical protein
MQLKLESILLSIVFVLLVPATRAQFYFYNNKYLEEEWVWEAGITAGLSNCLTDVGGNKGAGKKFIKDINWNQSRITGGFFVAANWQAVITARADFNFLQLSGSDAVLKNKSGIEQGRYQRNLFFKTTVTEIAGLAELHPLFISKRSQAPACSPYIIAGVGLFFYTPQASINNVWYNLRNLHTEGQGFKEYNSRNAYKKFSYAFPVGVGLKYDAGHLLDFRIEIVHRFTSTDYLDDVSTRYIDPAFFDKYLNASLAPIARQLANPSGSAINSQRGNPANKDGYFSAVIKMALVLNRKKTL